MFLQVRELVILVDFGLFTQFLTKTKSGKETPLYFSIELYFAEIMSCSISLHLCPTAPVTPFTHILLDTQVMAKGISVLSSWTSLCRSRMHSPPRRLFVWGKRSQGARSELHSPVPPMSQSARGFPLSSFAIWSASIASKLGSKYF